MKHTNQNQPELVAHCTQLQHEKASAGILFCARETSGAVQEKQLCSVVRVVSRRWRLHMLHTSMLMRFWTNSPAARVRSDSSFMHSFHTRSRSSSNRPAIHTRQKHTQRCVSVG